MSDPLVTPVAEVKAPDVVAVETAKTLTQTAPIEGFLGVQNPNAKERDMLEFLAGMPHEDNGDLLMQLRGFEQRLAPPKFGESRLTLLYNYVRTLQDVKMAESKRDALVR